MILNLHGLYGTAENTNYKLLSERYSASEIYSPQMQLENRSPDDVMDELSAVKGIDFIVGNSFGGFFAYVLSAKWGCPCLLVNPAIPPAKYIRGLVPDYPEEFLNQLKQLEVSALAIKAHQPVCDTFVILGRHDEVIDPNFTKHYLKNVELYEMDEGHHVSGEDCKKLIKKLVQKMEDSTHGQDRRGK